MKKLVLNLALAFVVMMGFVLNIHAAVPAAKIGTTEYATLAEAFAAVQDNVPTTIVVNDDLTISYSGATYVEISENKDITLDLNGKTISVTQGSKGYTRFFYVSSGGKLTLLDSQTGGTIEGTWTTSTSTNTTTMLRNAGGVVNIASGTYRNITDVTYSRVLDGHLDNKNGKVSVFNITGGNFYAKNGVMRMNFGNNELNIEGGTFVAENAQALLVSNTSGLSKKVNISGGTFTTVNGTNSVEIKGTGAVDSVKVTGGTFNATFKVASTYPQANVSIEGGKFNEFVSAGTGCKAVSGGYYVVPPTDYVADGCQVLALKTTEPEYAEGYRYIIDFSATVYYSVDGVTNTASIYSNKFAAWKSENPSAANAILLTNNPRVAGDANVVYDNAGTLTAQNIVLMDGSDYYFPFDYTANDISFTRTFPVKTADPVEGVWQALCLPFVATEPTNCQFADIYSATIDENGLFKAIAFVESDENEVNTPFIVKANTTTAVTFTGKKVGGVVAVANSEDMNVPECGTTKDRYEFFGLYRKTNMKAVCGFYLSTAGSFSWSPSGAVSLKGFRFYLTITNKKSKQKFYPEDDFRGVKFDVFEDENDITAIETIQEQENNTQSSNRIYNLAGQQISKLQKGVNIINRGKVFVQ